MNPIEIELSGKSFRLLGTSGPVTAAIGAALGESGGRPAAGDALADLLVMVHPLLPESGALLPRLAPELARVADTGRVVLVLSALAALPVRRHVDYSAAMAGALAELRGLAMAEGPRRLINAVGVGLIADGDQSIAGDARMAGHAAVGRPGQIADVVGAVLFLSDPANSYTTGQILNVDGGWSAGYGRNF